MWYVWMHFNKFDPSYLSNLDDYGIPAKKDFHKKGAHQITLREKGFLIQKYGSALKCIHVLYSMCTQ